MSEETELATDPRLEQNAPEPEPTPAADPAPTPTPEPEAAPEGDPEPTPEPKAAKAKKPVEEVLKGRIGHLTKQLATQGEQSAAEVARLTGELEVARTLLDAGGAPAPSNAPTGAAPAPRPQDGRTYTQAELNAEASRIAAQNAFTQQCNDIYAKGIEAHGDDFKEAVDNLNAVGVMSNGFLEAALATDAAPEVINALGSDPAEAARISQLPPVRMAAELTKLAAKLAPRPRGVSNAPAPIRPVGGAPLGEVDLAKAAEGGDDMSAYAAARAKQGFAYAMTSAQRRAAARARG